MRTCPRSLVLSPLVAILAAATASAAAITVGPEGSGADFTDIQSAIDASSGMFDRVLVLPGTYTGSFTINKDIDVIGSGPGVSILKPTTQLFISALPQVTASNLAAGARVRIAGFSPAPGEQGSLLVADGFFDQRNCAGPVTLAEIGADPGTLFSAIEGFLDTGVRIENCSRVIIDGCSITGVAEAAVLSVEEPAPPALLAVRSSVWINNSTLVGALGLSDSVFGVTEGGAGIDAGDSDVTLAWSTVVGGGGSSDQSIFVPGATGVGGPGILVRAGGVLQVDGGSTTNITGGRVGFFSISGLNAPGGTAIIVQDGGSVTTSLGLELNGGLDGSGQSPAPIFELQQGSLLTQLSYTTIAMRTSITRPLPGESFELELAGPPSTLVGIFSDNQSAAPLPLPGYTGAALIAPAVSETLIPVLTDAEGRATKTVTVPVLAAVGSRRYLQAAQLLGVAPASISAPVFVTAGF